MSSISSLFGSGAFGLAMGWHAVMVSHFCGGKAGFLVPAVYQIALASCTLIAGYAFGGLGGVAAGWCIGAAGSFGFLQRVGRWGTAERTF